MSTCRTKTLHKHHSQLSRHEDVYKILSPLSRYILQHCAYHNSIIKDSEQIWTLLQDKDYIKEQFIQFDSFYWTEELMRYGLIHFIQKQGLSEEDDIRLLQTLIDSKDVYQTKHRVISENLSSYPFGVVELLPLISLIKNCEDMERPIYFVLLLSLDLTNCIGSHLIILQEMDEFIDKEFDFQSIVTTSFLVDILVLLCEKMSKDEDEWDILLSRCTMKHEFIKEILEKCAHLIPSSHPILKYICDYIRECCNKESFLPHLDIGLLIEAGFPTQALQIIDSHFDMSTTKQKVYFVEAILTTELFEEAITYLALLDKDEECKKLYLRHLIRFYKQHQISKACSMYQDISLKDLLSVVQDFDHFKTLLEFLINHKKISAKEFKDFFSNPKIDFGVNSELFEMIAKLILSTQGKSSSSIISDIFQIFKTQIQPNIHMDTHQKLKCLKVLCALILDHEPSKVYLVEHVLEQPFFSKNRVLGGPEISTKLEHWEHAIISEIFELICSYYVKNNQYDKSLTLIKKIKTPSFRYRSFFKIAKHMVEQGSHEKALLLIQEIEDELVRYTIEIEMYIVISEKNHRVSEIHRKVTEIQNSALKMSCEREIYLDLNKIHTSDHHRDRYISSFTLLIQIFHFWIKEEDFSKAKDLYTNIDRLQRLSMKISTRRRVEEVQQLWVDFDTLSNQQWKLLLQTFPDEIFHEKYTPDISQFNHIKACDYLDFIISYNQTPSNETIVKNHIHERILHVYLHKVIENSKHLHTDLIVFLIQHNCASEVQRVLDAFWKRTNSSIVENQFSENSYSLARTFIYQKKIDKAFKILDNIFDHTLPKPKNIYYVNRLIEDCIKNGILDTEKYFSKYYPLEKIENFYFFQFEALLKQKHIEEAITTSESMQDLTNRTFSWLEIANYLCSVDKKERANHYINLVFENFDEVDESELIEIIEILTKILIFLERQDEVFDLIEEVEEEERIELIEKMTALFFEYEDKKSLLELQTFVAELEQYFLENEDDDLWYSTKITIDNIHRYVFLIQFYQNTSQNLSSEFAKIDLSEIQMLTKIEQSTHLWNIEQKDEARTLWQETYDKLLNNRKDTPLFVEMLIKQSLSSPCTQNQRVVLEEMIFEILEKKGTIHPNHFVGTPISDMVQHVEKYFVHREDIPQLFRLYQFQQKYNQHFILADIFTSVASLCASRGDIDQTEIILQQIQDRESQKNLLVNVLQKAKVSIFKDLFPPIFIKYLSKWYSEDPSLLDSILLRYQSTLPHQKYLRQTLFFALGKPHVISGSIINFIHLLYMQSHTAKADVLYQRYSEDIFDNV